MAKQSASVDKKQLPDGGQQAPKPSGGPQGHSPEQLAPAVHVPAQSASVVTEQLGLSGIQHLPVGMGVVVVVVVDVVVVVPVLHLVFVVAVHVVELNGGSNPGGAQGHSGGQLSADFTHWPIQSEVVPDFIHCQVHPKSSQGSTGGGVVVGSGVVV